VIMLALLLIAGSAALLLAVFFQLAGATKTSITEVPVGEHPIAVAVSERTNRTYVANYESSSVSVIDSLTEEKIADIAVGPFPESIAILEDFNQIYVAHGGQNGTQVSVIDGSNNSVVKNIFIGQNRIGLAVNDETNELLVGHWNYPSGSLVVINGTTNEVTRRVSISNASEVVAFDPESDIVYMLNGGDGREIIIRGLSYVSVNYFSLPSNNSAGGFIEIDPATERVYILKRTQEVGETDGMSVPAGTLFALASNSLEVIAALNVTSPSGMAIDGISNIVYVSNSWNSSVYVIDGETMQVVREITLSGIPGALEVDEDTGKLFVAVPGSNTISVLELDPARVPEFPTAAALVATVSIFAALIALRSRASIIR
jgi:YVTN family beta-propeller protein